MIPLLVVLSLFSNILTIPQGHPPAGSVEVQDAQAEYSFGQEIRIQARLKTNAPIEGAFLFLQFEDENPETHALSLDSDGDTSLTIDLGQRSIPPFIRAYYWFRVEFADGSEAVSPSFWFDYEDNRFDWQNMEDGLFEVYWYDGDVGFGQQVLTTARKGLTAVQNLFPVSPPPTIKIYVYSQPADMQTAIDGPGSSTKAGLANPGLGMMMVSIEPGQEQRLELERQIPHELTHLLLEEAAGPGYAQLPAWLIEGLASLAELYPDPDYERAVLAAVKADALLPLDTLCSALPQDASTQFLAYAQAADFTRFLRGEYGLSGTQSLVQAYSNGAGCDAGLRQTFDASLAELENQWREEIGGTKKPAPLVISVLAPLQGLLPYIVLFVVVLATPLITFLFVKKEKEGKLDVPEESE